MSEILVKKNISFKSIKGFNKTLKKASNETDEIVLNFSDVHKVDLSIIQLLISYQRYVKEQGKVLKLKNISAKFKEQLLITGMVR